MSYRLIPIFLLSMASTCAPAQSMYPTVSKAEQTKRDEERVPLLESELAFERQALEKTKNARTSGTPDERLAAIHRHEENIKAIRREIDASTNQAAPGQSARPAVKTVRAMAQPAGSNKTPRFWDPYNRAPDSTDFFTSPRRDSHE